MFLCILAAQILFCCACNNYKVTKNDPYGRYLVINPKWTIKTDHPDPGGLIDYNCVYIAKKPIRIYMKFGDFGRQGKLWKNI